MNSVLVRHKWEPYVWLLPSILLMTIFVVFPIGIVFKLAFSEISKAGIVGGFVGFANFKEAVSAPVFSEIMGNVLRLENVKPDGLPADSDHLIVMRHPAVYNPGE